MTAWNDFVKKIYHEGHDSNPNYQFKQALKDASKRKGEMGSSASSGSSKRKSKKSCMKSCKKSCSRGKKNERWYECAFKYGRARNESWWKTN